MRSKALVGLNVIGCAAALIACGGGGGGGGGGAGMGGSNPTATGSGGMGSGSMSSGSGGMGSGSMSSGSGGMGSGSMTSGTGGKGGGMNSGTRGKGGGTGGKGGGTGGMGASADCSMQGAPLPDGMCKATADGVYAIKTDLDVWWKDDNSTKNGFPIVDSGRGTITIYLIGELQVCDDGKGQGVLKACGSTLPAFTSDLTCDAYQLQFADEIWDKPDMPTFTTTGMTDGFDPGSILTIAQATGLVGINLDDATTWPTSAETGTFKCNGGMGTGIADCFPDQDGDGEHGVTVSLKLGGTFMPQRCRTNTTDANKPDCKCGGIGNPAFTYAGSPVSVADGTLAGGGSGQGVRTKEVHVGLSTTLGGQGTIAADCKSGMGDGMAPIDAIKSRVADCKIDPASLASGDSDPDHMAGNCSPSDATFVDDNVPNYRVLQKDGKPEADVQYPNNELLDPTPSMGPLSAVKRLGDRGGKAFTCADVRAAFK